VLPRGDATRIKRHSVQKVIPVCYFDFVTQSKSFNAGEDGLSFGRDL
jgi:hypothetical protein